MTKLLIDASSILGAFMHLNDEEFGIDVVFEGEKFHIPSLETCIERAEASFQRTITHLGISPTDMIMVRDQEGTGAARKLIYPEYKGKRDKRPRQFYTVFNALVEHVCNLVMESGGIIATPRVVPAIEADDLINELATRLPKTIIWTRDKDLLSCPATHHYIEGEIDPLKFPVPQHLIRLYRAIVTGDTSDNIPSCKGFGDKTWEKLRELNGWEGMDQLDLMVQQKRLHELASEVKDFKALQLLVDQAETVYLAYELISFMPVPARKIKWEARIESDVTKTLVTTDNFEICKSQVMASCKTAESVVIDYETDIPDEAREWIEQTDGAIKVDVIGSRIAGMGLKIGTDCWYFSVDHTDTKNITLENLEEILLLIKDKRVFAHNLGGFENPVTYNHYGWMFENAIDTRLLASYIDENEFQGLKILSKRWLQYEQETYAETLQKAQDAQPDVEVLGMRQVSGEQVISYGIDDVIVTDGIANLFTTILQYEKTWSTFLEVEPKALLVSSMAFVQGVEFDWDVYRRLKSENDINILRAKVELSEKLLALGWGDKEFKPSVLLNSTAVKRIYQLVMGRELVSSARSVSGLKESIIKEIEACQEEEEVVKLNSIMGALHNGLEGVNELGISVFKPTAEINIRSPKQVQTLLYDLLGCPVRIRNPPTDLMRKKGIFEGTPSTDDTAIANALEFKDTTKEGVEVLTKLVELKGYLTRDSLFLSKYPLLVHWKTGRLHCSMVQCGTTTRRFSHSAPNLAQLSKRKGKEMRDMIKAPKGWYLVAMDWSGQELRLAAWESQDANFLSCYVGEEKKRRDVHSLTGLEIALREDQPKFQTYEEFKAAIDKDDPDAVNFRRLGKTINFASQYGAKPKKLGQELRCPESDAAIFLDARNAAFPDLVPSVEEYVELCSKRGYSLTMLGARRHLHKHFAMKSQGEQASAGRLAYSYRIQGSAAEMTKLAMGRCLEQGLFDDGLCVCCFTVHDEICFYINESVIHERIPKLHACVVANYAGMGIDQESTPEIGTHFGSLKKYQKQ